MGRIKVRGFVLTRTELENYLIERFDLPDDIVVTGINKPVNQEAWLVTVHSANFPVIGELDTISTSKTPENEIKLTKP